MAQSLDLFAGDIDAASDGVHVDAARNKAYQLGQIMKRNKHMNTANITASMEKVRKAADSDDEEMGSGSSSSSSSDESD